MSTITTWFRNSLPRRALGFALIGFLVLRLMTSLLMIILVRYSPVYVQVTAPHSAAMMASLEQSSFFSHYFLAPWYRWDTARYLTVAVQGYASDPSNTIWPPLYPLLIRAAAWVVKPPLLAALLVSNIAAVIGLWLLYLLVAQTWSEGLAQKALVLVITFPSGFFLVAGYSESLFLTFVVGMMLLIRQQRWGWAGLLGALAVLTRLQGIFVVLPLLWVGGRWALQSEQGKRGRILHVLLATCLVFLAVGLWFAYVRFSLNQPWPWQSLAGEFGQHVGWPWEGIVGNIDQMIFNPSIGVVGLFYNLLGALLGIAFLLPLHKWKTPMADLLFGWGLLMVVLIKLDMNNTLGGDIRYVLPIYPLFMNMAKTLKSKTTYLAWLVFAVASQVILLSGFYWWIWYSL